MESSASPSQESSNDRPETNLPDFQRAEMHTLAQRIAAGDASRQIQCKRMNDRYLESKSGIVDKYREFLPIMQELFRATSQICKTLAKLWRGGAISERLSAEAKCLEGILGHIDAVEPTIVITTVLQVIDDLQRCTDGVRCWPSGAAFTVNVKHEPSDGHGRVPAVLHEIVPVSVPTLAGIEPECFENILGVMRREFALGKSAAQCRGLRTSVAVAKEIALQAIVRTNS
jgi:hypothetical protein